TRAVLTAVARDEREHRDADRKSSSTELHVVHLRSVQSATKVPFVFVGALPLELHQGNHSCGTFCHAVGRRGSSPGITSEPTNSACSYTLPIDREMLSRSMSLTTPLLVAL